MRAKLERMNGELVGEGEAFDLPQVGEPFMLYLEVDERSGVKYVKTSTVQYVNDEPKRDADGVVKEVWFDTKNSTYHLTFL